MQEKNEINIDLEDDNIDIDFTDEDSLDINTSEMIEIKTTTDHSELDNLDYAHSGHTGFAYINILDNIYVDEEKETLIIPKVSEVA